MNMSSNEELPFVSVVVPVYNGENYIAKNIESLLAQEYPKEKYEILIIDNGSTDATNTIAAAYPVTRIEESKARNSYVARNRGIAVAKGSILAFTDADCVAKPDWISRGIARVSQEQGGIVGGKIEFLFSEKKTSAELLDSLINLNNELFITLRHSAQTANVFIPKTLFTELGLFPDTAVSGGDALWTNNAWKGGKSLVYDASVVVFHPTRNCKELLEKHFRVGRGCVAVWQGRGKNVFWISARIASLFLPILAFRLPGLITKWGRKDISYPLIKMMGVSYLCTLANVSGIAATFYRSLFRKS